MKLLEPVSFGGDPEIFVAYDDGTIGCPSDFLPKSKVVQPISSVSGGVNRDGLAFELNPSPASSPRVVAGHIFQLMADGGKALADIGLRLVPNLMADVRDTRAPETTGLPEDVYALGCDPDYSAYTGKPNVVTVDPKKYTKRFAGGHITMQLPFDATFQDVRHIVKLFDLYAGLYSIRWSDGGSIERRRTYGKAGAFRWHRAKRIVEYRTPDAGWVWNDGYEVMCNQMRHALISFQRGMRLLDSTLIRKAINQCDKQLAGELVP